MTLGAIRLPLSAFARQGTPPRSQLIRAKALIAIEQLVVSPTHVAEELAADGPVGREAPLRRNLHTGRPHCLVLLNHQDMQSVPVMFHSKHFVQGSTSKK